MLEIVSVRVVDHYLYHVLIIPKLGIDWSAIPSVTSYPARPVWDRLGDHNMYGVIHLFPIPEPLYYVYTLGNVREAPDFGISHIVDCFSRGHACDLGLSQECLGMGYRTRGFYILCKRRGCNDSLVQVDSHLAKVCAKHLRRPTIVVGRHP